MIIPVGAFLIGAIFGALRARLRGGKPLDMLQWGAVFGLILGMIGLFVMIYLDRSLRGA